MKNIRYNIRIKYVNLYNNLNINLPYVSTDIILRKKFTTIKYKIKHLNL